MAISLSKIVLFASLLQLVALTSGSSSALSELDSAQEIGSLVSETIPSKESAADREFNGVYSNPDLVGFYLYYDPMNVNVHDVLEFRDVNSIANSHYDPQKPTKFLIHGFTQNGTSSFPMNVKNSYLKNTGTMYNIIAVDWGKLSSPKYLYPLFYSLAKSNVPKVGKRVGEFILFLKANGYISEEQVHIIGFSLGAHAASNAGYYFRKQTGKKVSRITGLDPAGPGFALTELFVKRLEKSDAEFVDVIHGNAGGLGFPVALGHVDFWPNGGTIQPTCGVEINEFTDSLTGLLSGSCSHGKAPVYFAMSISPFEAENMVACKYISRIGYRLGRKCKETAKMGEYVSRKARGSYYLDVIPVPDEELLEMDAKEAAEAAAAEPSA